ncbi:N(5)-(carboxyethyl)ornithine synthase [Planococcus sp. ISL-109]|uniref:N(5)-(carboxyethyl)ornithine synthase n=1 Tax=Planococcus sp. ISL-109 TaxID=2819166 RepID=UPI001BE7B51D|nr:N(5)-(carboxyethyl)ornithine synthase [Planococcus sp. ISL-109]MBT2581183.1 N(5)-(carboxyethyl)ornithine synthase [Planococcus sp. ISL-109]
MKTIGFVISRKNNEKRRAILPLDLAQVEHPERLYFEQGYGDVLGLTDEDYSDMGATIATRDTVLACDAIVDVKLGYADYFDQLEDGKLLIGWAHAVQDVKFTDGAIAGKHTVVAWEELFEGGRYIFYRNREVAGEAAVLQAYQYCGKMPYETRVAILGNGHTGKGAMRILHGLGADVDVYGRKSEALFREKMFDYDVLVNCIMWDTTRTDRIIYREDLKRLKKGAMIIDVSCDPELAIETTLPTTIDNPVYTVDGVVHYAVDNTPAMFPHTITKVLSTGFAPMLDELLAGKRSEMVQGAIVIEDGIIKDQRITAFREARGMTV